MKVAPIILLSFILLLFPLNPLMVFTNSWCKCKKNLTITVSIITFFEENVKIYYMKIKPDHSCFYSHTDLKMLLDSFLAITIYVFICLCLMTLVPQTI
jgi:hypothetical protein